MKKLLLLIGACLLFSKVGMSQDTKNVRFGIRTTPTINMMNPGTNKKVNKNGAVMKAGIGLVLEFKLSDVASFQTGVEYTGAGLKAKYDKDTAMYRYKDDAVVESDGLTDTSLFVFNKTGGGSTYQVTSRKYNIGYLNIPLTFKLRTKEISGMTYFGQIGGNVFIKTSAKADDEVKKLNYSITSPTGITYASADPIEKINISNQVNLLTACGSIGAGAEYNISGSTALYGSIHYQHHFMNATKADSDYLIRQKREGTNYTYSQFPNAMKLRQIVLAIGILF